jgi:hypothetical protein
MKKLVLMTLLAIGTTGFVLGQNNGNGNHGNGNNGNGNNGKGNNGKGNNGKGNNGDAGVVPEIDPNSAASAMALLSGGVLVIRGRRKK